MGARTRRKGGFLKSLAKAYVNNVALPVGKYAVKQAINRSGLSSTPEYQAAKTAYRDVRSAYQSPTVQAIRPVPMAQPVPMARPVALPVTAPVPQPMAAAAPSLSEDELALATIFLVGQSDGSFREEIAKAATSQAVAIKNRDKNLALLDGVGKLASEVKALHESGAPMGAAARISGNRRPGPLAQLLPMLQDPAVRSRVAAYLVAAREPGPNERRFLSGSINQLATAIRIGFQQKVLLGGKTRRRQARRARSTRRR
jgi:hypothetical protein